MKEQETKTIKFFRPHFTQDEAICSVEQKKRMFTKIPVPSGVEWLSSIPLYIPFCIAAMQMRLHDPLQKGKVDRTYRAMVNGLTNRGKLLQGQLEYETEEVTGIIMDTEHTREKMLESARFAVFSATNKVVNPPPVTMLEGDEVVYYPMALVHCTIKGKEDVRVFDYYRGGLDKFFLSYLRYKEQRDERNGIRPNVNPIPKFE